MANIGFIGTGEIAAAMVCGLAGQGHSIVVSERNAKMATQLADKFDDVTITANQRVLDQSDIVILCLMKSVAEQELPKLTFAPGHKVISVMVDVPMDRLRELCPGANSYAITIPLPMIAKGGCPLPVFGDSDAVSELFASRNPILPQTTEDALNAHFAACAMGSVVLDQLQTAANWLTDVTGERAAAETYLSRMISGYLNGFTDGQTGQMTATLNALSAEGGLNATLRAKLAEGGALEDIEQGLDGFRGRLGLPSAK